MAKYDIEKGIKKIKVKVAIAASAVIAVSGFGMAVAIPALSHAQDSVYTQASACGQYHAAVADQTGNYGFLGKLGGTPYYDSGNKTTPGERAVGQQQGATGYNNSQSC